LTTLLQPTLPAEVTFTIAELNFLDESPPGLFPENQNSNFGFKRKIFCDQIQDGIDQLNLIYSERFVQTAVTFLDEWEYSTGIPIAPTGISDEQRRANILSILRKGPFTRIVRKKIIESYINVAFGTPILLLPPGHPLDPGGSPLLIEQTALENLYRAYEDIQRFRYLVKIDSDAGIDQAALQIALHRITPGGISFTIDTSETVPLDYKWDTFQTEPEVYWRLGESAGPTAQEEMIGNKDGTYNGTFTFAQTGALAGDTDDAVSFDGSTAYISVADATELDLGDIFTIEFWVKRNVTGTLQYLFTKGGNAYALAFETDDTIILQKHSVGTIVASNIAITDTNWHYIVITKNGAIIKIYIDNVDRTGTISNQTLTNNSSDLNIGRNDAGSNYFSGLLDEVAFYKKALSASIISRRWDVGRDILS